MAESALAITRPANPAPLGLAGAGDFGYATGKVGGYIGVLTGIDALLVAFVETLNATANRVVIPLGAPFVTN